MKRYAEPMPCRHTGRCRAPPSPTCLPLVLCLIARCFPLTGPPSPLSPEATRASACEFPLPTNSGMPSMITTGSDAALWFTLNQANAIGRTGLDGDVTLHHLPTAHAGPVGITSGTDDAVWFVEIGAGQVGRITPEGRITEFPRPDRAARPHAIVVATTDGCWFSEWGANRIGHITTAGKIEEHDLPAPSSEPHGLTVGSDGCVYVALEIGTVARLQPNG